MAIIKDKKGGMIHPRILITAFAGGHQYTENLIPLESYKLADNSGLPSHPALQTDHTFLNISAWQQALINHSD